MIEDKIKKNRCTGCSACFNACKFNCIEMIENEEGFLYPKVDLGKCKECKMCIKSCPLLKEKNILNNQEIIAAYSKDDENRKNSSSGGCFGEFAKMILNQKGIVFGVGYDENFNVVHKCVTNIEELQELKGSKYVQSKISDSYKTVQKYLIENKKVLFSGTPCQIAGLKSFLGKNYENLYTIDIVCHGVPSQKLFNKYLETYEKAIKNLKFRDKTNGWNQFGIKVMFEDGEEKVVVARKDNYMRLFLTNMCLRKSCYNCEFRESQSDITIGDFWGIDKINNEINDDKGISVLLINTLKGKQIFEQVKEDIIFYEGFNKDEIVKYNSCIKKSVKEPAKRKTFFKDLEEVPFEKLVKKNVKKQNIIKRCLKKIYIVVKKK